MHSEIEANTEHILYEVAEAINSASTHEELSLLIWKFCNRFGVENYVFGSSLYNNLNAIPEIHILNGYPEGWWKRYEEKNYLNDDLTVAHCQTKSSPIIWPQNDKKMSRVNKKIFAEASEFGIKAGISIPYHGRGCEFGALSVSVSEDYQKSVLKNPTVLYSMQIIGASLFDFLKCKTKKESTNTLTKREKECLKWVAAGKTSWEISMILGIAERTVIFHIQNAATKMNTASRTSAAIIALRNGEI